jgi:outer membrane receptor protein involved in Fe transport
MSKLVRLSCTAFIILALSAIVFAQSTVTGAIGGKVTDPQGASLPSATVTATNVGTNQESTVTADEDGGFRVVNLQPGTYNVRVSSAGFADFTQERVIVEVGQVTSLNIPLSVAGATASVDVTADAPVINNTSPDLSININQTSINELPINGRRATDFVLLTPASVPDGPFGLISFRGISGLLNNSTVDGGDNNQSFQSEERGRTRIAYVVSQSSIREFQVNTSNYSAEYGRSAGAVVNSVTKSGTNEFHGELFEYYRNNRFGARNPRAVQSVLVNGVATSVGIKPLDIRHQFGGAIGGPIVKNHLFFFFSYDQQKRNFPGLSVFSNANYLNTVNRTTLLARGLSTAQIDSTLSYINSLTGQTPRRGDQRIIFPKIDWQINGNNTFTASYNRLRWESPAGLQTQATNTLARRSFGSDFVSVDSLNLRLQSTISPTLLNEARFQYAQDHEFALSQEPLPGEPLTATTSQGARTPFTALTNGITFGTSTNFERLRYPFEDRTQFADTVTWIRGTHTLRFGGDFNHVVDDIQNLGTEAGSYTYNNINDFIIDYTNFVTPLAPGTLCATTARTVGRCYTSNFVQGVGIPGIKFSEDEYSFFVQDDIRVTPRLTVNLGLRYEYQKLPSAPLPNTSSTIIPNDLRTLAEATSTMPSDTNNWGPRFGFAYDLTGDGKTSIRGGAGLYYGRFLGGHIWNNLLKTGNPGGQGTVSIAPTSAAAPIYPNVLPNNNQTLGAATIFFYERNFQTPKIAQFDFILEREIAQNTVASISYVGSLGRHLPTFVDMNLAPTGATRTFTTYGGDFDGQTFTLPLYARANTALPSLLQEQSSVKSEYNALIFQANRRFTDGLQFQASYTWAKSTDTGQNSLITTSIFNQPVDVFNRTYDAGPSSFDVRHKLVVSAVYSPTLNKDADSFEGYLLNGWTIAPIFVYYSGAPFSPIVSGSALNGSNGDNRFTQLPRNSFRLPSIKNVDLRVSKRFNFTERYNLEFLGEAFNLFNRTQVFGQSTTLYTPSNNCVNINGTVTNNPNGLCFTPAFAGITTTDSNKYRERQIQFAVRFHF